MKKEITITVAALSFIASATGVYSYETDNDYICDTSTQMPLIMNFADEFAPEVIENQKIESVKFSIDCRTNLDPERAYLTQGQLYYYSDGEFTHRNFADLVSVSDEEYESIRVSDSVCTEITVGTENNPLNLDIDKDVTLYWTWITPEKLSMYNFYVTTTDGITYMICYDEDYYTVEISDKMQTDKPQVKADDNFMFPIKGRYCITSVYGWDTDRYHDALDICSYSDDNIYSACDGTVDYAGWNDGYGNYVRVMTDDGEYQFCYGHLSEIDVELGQRVSKGDKLGVIGATGRVTGPHLDFSAMRYGAEVNIAELVGVENDYGDYEAVTETVVENNELAVKCLSLNKYFEVGSLGANGICPNDSGSLSIGLVQMRGSNAKKLLKYLYDNNPVEYAAIANKYDNRFISYLDKSDDWWENHSIVDGDNEFKYINELLDNDNMIKLQYEYCLNYEKDIIDDIVSNSGTNDEKYILLFSRCYNYAPWGTTPEVMRTGITYEEACEIAKNDKYILKADELINKINNDDIEIVTIESLKGER